MREITVSIPHELTRAEARNRIEAGIVQTLRENTSLPLQHTRAWDGDTMSFSVQAMGITIPGRIDVADQLVWVRVSLPFALALLANVIKPSIEREGRKLLTAER